ncbi:MAG: protein phosphatase 2C domain-containing protein [Thermodesulfobacteriota bacterium]|nr:protein phosphatase 2C domain-containing protein [Thermodesulfobacteriota bacterium]
MKSEEGRALVGGFQVEYAGYSDTGRVRSINEDDFLLLPQKGVFCLADGLGGLERGEVASVIALESIQSLLSAAGRHGFLSFSKNFSLQQMISHANTSVYEKRQKLKLNTATTMIIAQIHDHTVEVGHVGDSRAYQWDGNSLLRCTRDHSLVEELFRNKGLSEEQLLNHPQRHIITRAVGAGTEVKANIQGLDIQDGNLVLLCSDGLTTMLANDEMESILRRHHPDVNRTGQALITAANKAGGRDNITVVLLRITDFH